MAGLEFVEAIQFLRQKKRVPTEHWSDIWRGANSTCFIIGGVTDEVLLEDFHLTLVKAMEEGTTLQTFRQDFDAICARHKWSCGGSRDWRSRIIYETNLATAYAAGRYAQFTETETLKAFPYWKYRYSGSNECRPEHKNWDGLILPAGDPFWDTHYPPNGWGCGCRVSPCDLYDLNRPGQNGPDEAPSVDFWEWRNNHTGVVHMVPVGISPGWDYNHGKVWKGHQT